jgi:hypothetical protein
MTQSKDPNDADAVDSTERLPEGRVEFDSRGNSVWRWAREVIENTSVLLKRLDNKDLALEPTQKVPVMRGADKSKGQPAQQGRGTGKLSVADKSDTPGGGFDPYNRR